MRLRWFKRAAFGGLLIVVFIVAGTAFRVWHDARLDDRSHADVIVVLGAAQYNGTPSEIFQARLQHAKNLFNQQVAPVIVTVGGSKAGDKYTEGQVGARWLKDHGVPASATLAVGQGRDTLESLQVVAAELKQRSWHTAVIVSDPWHSLRARTMAQDAGIDAWTSPTHRGPIVQTRQTQAMYIFRETGALLFYRISKNSADAVGGTSIG